MKNILRIWKYSLGSFSDGKTEPYDNWIAIIRSIIFVSYMVTNAFIVSGVIRHWNSTSDAPLRDWNSSDCVSVDTELIKK